MKRCNQLQAPKDHAILRAAVLFIVLLLAAAPIAAAPPTALSDYVNAPDKTYAYKVLANRDTPTGTVYTLQLTSQRWRGQTWKHWLTIVTPREVKYPGKAVLVIGGGSNRTAKPRPDSGAAQVVKAIAGQLGVTVAILEQVPNQPLFGDKYEDAIIAYTFDKYLKQQGDDWPLLLPMTKAAVRAMDAVGTVSKEKLDAPIDKFIVTGASKRGWTTYLTAATDKRVIAIAPMVFDTLNLEKQTEHQVKSYGRFSSMVDDYTQYKLQERLQTERGKMLNAIVDPYTYRAKLTMPKLLLLGTNDPYWTADSASLYFNDLPEPKHLYYEANGSHGLGMGVVPTMLAFLQASLEGRTLPKVTARALANGSLRVTWEGGSKPRAKLWEATSVTRDFRKARWTSKALVGSQQHDVPPAAPASGWVARFVGVSFPSQTGLPYRLDTPILVAPGRYPDHSPPRRGR